jgi:hypothetical protein
MTSLNADFRDVLSCFNAGSVEYLVVGAYALAAHGLPRATGDIDLWVRATPENAQRVADALVRFGAPAESVSVADFALSDRILQIGVPPGRVDVITSIDGVEFDDAWPRRLEITLEGLPICILGRADLLRNKRAVARPQDLADVARLEALERVVDRG